MSKELLRAINQISAERKLPDSVVKKAIENALASVYMRDSDVEGQGIIVDINLSNGDVTVKTVRKVVSDEDWQAIEEIERPAHISLTEAHKKDENLKIGDYLETGQLPYSSGRAMAHSTKQLIIQNLREAERSVIFELFKDQENKLINGEVQRVERRSVFINMDGRVAVMPSTEQSPNEHYRTGQKMKFFVAKVEKTPGGPEVILSRSHPNLLRVLFETEVPEIKNGTVEIKAIAREPGSRSKIAVYSTDQKVDPVGTCIGLRGLRIQNIVNELMGEKVDVVEWKPDVNQFIMNSLNPATVESVVLDEAVESAKVYVQDNGLSLAIGRDGQNARLATKLTNWKIDIASVTELSVSPKPPVEKTKKEDPELVEENAPAASKPAETKADKDKDVVDVKALEEELEDLRVQEAEQPAEQVEQPVDTLDFEAEGIFTESFDKTNEIRFAEDISEVRRQRSAQSNPSTAKKKKRTKSK